MWYLVLITEFSILKEQKLNWCLFSGVNFGLQSILDRSVNLTTSFVKQAGGTNGGDWSNRITVEPIKKKVSQELMIIC